MLKEKEQIVLTRHDYELILANLRSGSRSAKFNRQEADELEAELRRATLVEQWEMPSDVVQLNSSVTIREHKQARIMQFTVVVPEKADIKQQKISIMSPVGAALIGYRKGQKVAWNVPAGRKTFVILDVQNVNT